MTEESVSSEREDLPGKRLAAVAVGTLAFAALLVALAALITHAHPAAGRGLHPLVPLFEPAPLPSVDELGWVDRTRGIVRIPVEDAIDILSGGRP